MERIRCIFKAILRQKDKILKKKVQKLLFFGSKKIKKKLFFAANKHFHTIKKLFKNGTRNTVKESGLY